MANKFHLIKIKSKPKEEFDGAKHTPTGGHETTIYLDDMLIQVSELELISIKGQVGNLWIAKIVFPAVRLEGPVTALAEIEGPIPSEPLDGPPGAR